MKKRHKTIKLQNISWVRISSLILLFLFIHASIVVLRQTGGASMHAAAPAQSSEVESVCGSFCNVTGTGSDEINRMAEKIKIRLAQSGSIVPSTSVLADAIRHRQDLLKKSVMVSVKDPTTESGAYTQWTVALTNHSELLELHYTWVSASYELNEDLLAQYIAQQKFANEQSLSSVVVRHTVSDKKVERADSVPVAHDGFDYNVPSLAHSIVQAFDDGLSTITLSVPYKHATVQIANGSGTETLELLSSGLSNFADSPPERVWNVHKAIDERVNNVIVAPGKVFSFVDTLGVPITLDKGWKEGLGLFGGGAALTPGAGICQAATTVYRAALLAGLPIVEKMNHSMWVPHYEPYGVGLDATVFPNFHDLRFRNDTNHSILVQAFTTGEDVTVNLYGVSDHRTVAMDGPYFYATPHRAAGLSPLGRDQIGWVQHVTYNDGKIVTKEIISTYYKGIPRKVSLKYADFRGIDVLKFAEAPSVAQ